MSQDQEAIIEAQLIADYQKLYRLAYSYVHNEGDALDIVQECAYKAIKNSKSLKNPIADVMGFLLNINLSNSKTRGLCPHLQAFEKA